VKQILRPNPATPAVAVTRIEVDVRRFPGHIELDYCISGRIADVRLPAFATAARTDELWKHTCFEAFVRPASGTAYYEFNFAPSTQWAAYGFAKTREGMHNADATPERIEAEQDGQTYTLRVAVDLTRIPALLEDDPWRLNITAVIEETDGRKSYWALAHPPGKPDFHHPDCFVLELPAA